jgi:cytochrome oxidase Cu insertion factor (SCO1/SenC/PrrC family)
MTGTLLGLATAAVLFTWGPLSSGSPGAGGPDPLVPAPFPAPDFALETLEGESFTAAELTGEVSVVFFGFASCPDICPITLGRLSGALELLEIEQSSFRGIFVSVDPWRDTPERLREYMGAFHPSIVALTGTPADLRSATEAWGVHVAFRELPDGEDPHAHHAPGSAPAAGNPGTHAPEPHAPQDRGEPVGGSDPGTWERPAGEYAVEHATRSLVVDARGRVVASLAPFLTSEEIVAELRPHLRR